MTKEISSTGYLSTRLPSPSHSIFLRPLEVADARSFSVLLSDPKNTQFDKASKVDVETAKGIITAMRESAASESVVDADGKVVSGPDRVNLAIVYMTFDGKHVVGLTGFGSIKTMTDGRRIGDVGVMLDSRFRRRGFSAEALRLAMEFGFAKVEDDGLQLDEITATMRIENKPMIGLLEKKFSWKGRERISPEQEGLKEMFFETTPEGFEALELDW
jgi:RimJ/RimL family protein N-acetyltransferase